MNRTIVCFIALAALLTLAALHAGGGVRPAPPDGEAVTMAMEFGLQRNRIASFDSHLSDRLVRFGKVAQARGHHREAKRYFWQAIMVAPTNKLAWMYYDQAVLFTLAGNVERMPALVGLPGLSDQEGNEPVKPKKEPEEGC